MALTVQTPIDPSGQQGLFNQQLAVTPLFLGTFLFASLPTVLPASLGGGAIPPGSMAIVTNATSVVRGAATTGGGAVTMQIFWDGATWRN